MEYLTELASKYLDLNVVGDFEKVLLLFGTIVFCILALLLLLFILKIICFEIYTHCSNEDIQEAVTEIIYKLDEFADTMSNKQKKQAAINDVKSLFIWRNIPIPNCVIGWIIDAEVKVIRKLQKKYGKEKEVDLYHEETTSENIAELKVSTSYDSMTNPCHCPECKKKYRKFFDRNYTSKKDNIQ